MFSKQNYLGRLLRVQHQILYAHPVRKFSAANSIRSLNSGVCMIPHTDKRHKGGEDAYVVTDTMVAVADGVGGWAEAGIDPALFSRELCRNITDIYEKSVQQNTPEKQTSVISKPRELLVQAVAESRQQGSSTAVICMLDHQKNYLHTANLGDSGYLLLRKNGYDLTTVYRSKEQTHGFNFPYQVGVGGDDPSRADLQVHEIQPNDILIVGSDGLFDNMFDDQITEVMKPFIKTSDELLDPELVAQMIAKQAEKLSLNTTWMSPFAKHAYDNYYDFKGGKHDDVTVVVSQFKVEHIE